MDFGTNITKFKSIPFPDEGTRATGSVPDVRDEIAPTRPGSRVISEDQPPAPANSLPQSILSSWSRIAQANMSVRMYGDLVRIAAQQPGWRGLGSRGLRPASLRNFLEFWSAIRDGAAEPELALAPDGTLHAEWFKSQRQRLDVRFLDHQVLFGLFANNTILEGAEHRDTVAQILNAHHAKPLSWSSR
jgi:hypothetical protein